MIYVIGGYSYAKFDFDSDFEFQGFTNSQEASQGFDGFHVGAGIEAMLTQSLMARVEYRYTDYESHRIDIGEDFLTDFDFEPVSHTGTIGISWLFNEL